MRRIVYVSTSSVFSDADVARMVEKAAAKNAALGITGFLLYNGHNFLQLIEGEASTLAALIVRIEADQRHHGVVRLIDESVRRRSCTQWGMRRVDMTLPPAERLSALVQVLPRLDRAAAKLVSNFALLN